MDGPTLRVNAERLGYVREVISYLNLFADAYNHIYAFEMIVREAEKKHEEINGNGYGSREKPVRTLAKIPKPEEVVLPEDRLRLKSVVIESPGFWDFLGNINPFEVLRKYLCDRHERRRDAAYRDRQEEERGEMELERLRTQVVQEKVELLRSLGVPEEKIRQKVYTYITEPLRKLDGIQERSLILDAEIIMPQQELSQEGHES